MNKAFNKILERLEELKEYDLCNGMLCSNCEEKYGGDGCGVRQQDLAIDECKAIIQEVAEEYKGGWIACSERLPEESGEYLVTSKIYFVPDHVDEIDNYVGVKISHYSIRYGWLDDEVMAWQPLPEPYKERDSG